LERGCCSTIGGDDEIGGSNCNSNGFSWLYSSASKYHSVHMMYNPYLRIISECRMRLPIERVSLQQPYISNVCVNSTIERENKAEVI
jgi:hypothetical protein